MIPWFERTRFVVVYMLDLNVPLNATPNMDNFSKKYIFVDEKTKVGGGHFVRVSKPFEDIVIIKIAKGIEIDGLERKSGHASPQRA